MSEEQTNPVMQEQNSAEMVEAQQESAAETQMSTVKKISGKVWGMIGTAVVILIALIVGFNIYNSPEKRLTRQLELGNRYLEEQNYEQAAIAFEEAITIDGRCIEAYAGGILAYQELGDQEKLTDIYGRSLQAVAGLDEVELAENMETVVGIYLTAEDVYSDNADRVTEILEDGLTRTGDRRIKDKLIEYYLKQAKGYADAGDYESALEIYDRLLELDETNRAVQSDVGSCLEKYLELLIEQKRYDEARALIGKYQDKVTTVDFQSYLDRITELERIEAENRAYMQMIYDLMAAEDYEAMGGVDGSEESTAFVEKLVEAGEESYVYLPEEGSLTGTGAGVYRFGEGGYYFYYGSYAEGSREGNGTTFISSSGGGYEVFTGRWQNDAPNGEGKIEEYGAISSNGTLFSLTLSGNLVNGLWDGPVDKKLYDSQQEGIFDLSYTAVNGIPQEDRTDEFFNSHGHVDLEEGEKIIAFDNVGDNWWYEHIGLGKKLGVTGFTD